MASSSMSRLRPDRQPENSGQNDLPAETAAAVRLDADNCSELLRRDACNRKPEPEMRIAGNLEMCDHGVTTPSVNH